MLLSLIKLDVWSMVFLDHIPAMFLEMNISMFVCYDVRKTLDPGRLRRYCCDVLWSRRLNASLIVVRLDTGNLLQRSPSLVLLVPSSPCCAQKMMHTQIRGFVVLLSCQPVLYTPEVKVIHRLQWSVVTNVTKNSSIIRPSPKGLPSWLYHWFCENQFMYCDKIVYMTKPTIAKV